MNNPSEQALSWSFNYPNAVTIIRVVLTIPIVWLVCLGGMEERLLAAVLLTFAWATDGLDGFLARRLGQSSLAGALFDLTADRIIMTPTLILSIIGGFWVGTAGLMPFNPFPYAVVVIIADLTVIIGVLLFLWKRRSRDIEFPAPTQIARISYSVQMPTLILGVLGTSPPWLLAVFMYAAIIITIAAFYSYFSKAAYVFFS